MLVFPNVVKEVTCQDFCLTRSCDLQIISSWITKSIYVLMCHKKNTPVLILCLASSYMKHTTKRLMFLSSHLSSWYANIRKQDLRTFLPQKINYSGLLYWWLWGSTGGCDSLLNPLAELSSLTIPQYITWAEGLRAHHDARGCCSHKNNGHGGKEGYKDREGERGSWLDWKRFYLIE